MNFLPLPFPRSSLPEGERENSNQHDLGAKEGESGIISSLKFGGREREVGLKTTDFGEKPSEDVAC